MKRKDITNQRFGRLLVLSPTHLRSQLWYWKCKCDCGTVKEISGADLRRGTTISCGCYRAESASKRRKAQANPIRRMKRDRFCAQRSGAHRRGIPWKLTFEEWWEIWEKSGHWAERGIKKGQYVMARFGDVGPYSTTNVRICTAEENHEEFKHTEEHKESVRKRMKGNIIKITPEGRQRQIEGVKRAAQKRREAQI